MIVDSVRWCQYGDRRVIDKGQMLVSQIPHSLKAFEMAARKVMEYTGADHVLYGAKIYDKADTLASMQFYMMPMCDAEFQKITRRIHNSMIYALHRR